MRYIEFYNSSNPLFCFCSFINCTVSLMEGCNIIRSYLLSKCQISVMIKRKQPILSQNLLYSSRIVFNTKLMVFIICSHYVIIISSSQDESLLVGVNLLSMVMLFATPIHYYYLL